MRFCLLLLAGFGVVAASCPGKLNRQDCGFPGISEAQCAARQCCWDDSAPEDWCALPVCDGSDPTRCVHGSCQGGMCVCEDSWTGPKCEDTPITTVHVVQSCHLDVGFANTAPGIVNLWFDHHFPYAISVAQELKAANSTARLKFMVQSYLVSLFLDCPSGMGLNCPNATQVSAFKAAVADGVIWWHAFPHNAELETMSPVLIQEGVKLSQSLQAELGSPVSKTLSQRDVPGMTRSVIPILARAGVTAINVGANGASTPPDVPKIFKWLDVASGESVVGMWHPYGYGGFDINSAITVPGLSHALVTDWNGDNAGPFSAADYQAHFAAIQKEFPNATVVASTWEDFTQYLPSVESALPVITSELGDTWIYGVPSDPRRVAVLKVVNRAWDEYIAAGGARDPVYLNATRLVLKAGEHTWGADVKSHLTDNNDWSNMDFEKARVNPSVSGQFAFLETSWWRQREWCTGFALQALLAGGHPLGTTIASQIQQLAGAAPSPSDLSQYTLVTDPASPFDCGGFVIGFDAKSGAIVTLVNKATGESWATPSSPIFLIQYQSYNVSDVEGFISAYVTSTADWAQHDFGKPNVTLGQPVQATYPAQLLQLYVKKGSATVSFLLQSTTGQFANTMAGGAEAIWTQIDVPTSSPGSIQVSMSVLNKTTTRLPEAMFVTFNPADVGGGFLDKLGELVNVTDVVDGGAMKIHFVASGFQFKRSNGSSLVVGTTDAGVVCAGKPYGYPIPLTQLPDVPTYGMSSILWSNLWGTNYIMWYPFSNTSSEYPTPNDPDLLYRFTLSFSS